MTAITNDGRDGRSAMTKLAYEYLGRFIGLADVAECGLDKVYIVGKLVALRDAYQQEFKAITGGTLPMAQPMAITIAPDAGSELLPKKDGAL